MLIKNMALKVGVASTVFKLDFPATIALDVILHVFLWLSSFKNSKYWRTSCFSFKGAEAEEFENIVATHGQSHTQKKKMPGGNSILRQLKIHREILSTTSYSDVIYFLFIAVHYQQ